MRSWRNWQTRKTKDLVGNSMQVQFLSTAPQKRKSQAGFPFLFYISHLIFHKFVGKVCINSSEQSPFKRLRYKEFRSQCIVLLSVDRQPHSENSTGNALRAFPVRCNINPFLDRREGGYATYENHTIFYRPKSQR